MWTCEEFHQIMQPKRPNFKNIANFKMRVYMGNQGEDSGARERW